MCSLLKTFSDPFSLNLFFFLIYTFLFIYGKFLEYLHVNLHSSVQILLQVDIRESVAAVIQESTASSWHKILSSVL